MPARRGTRGMERTYEAVQSKLVPAMREVASVGEVLAVAAETWGDAPYLTYTESGETVGFAAMERRAQRVANALADVGVERGDRVGLYLTNGPAFVTGVYACSKLGAVETPINWQYREREVRHAIESAEISTVIVEPAAASCASTDTTPQNAS